MRHLRKLLFLSLGAALAGCGGPSPEPGPESGPAVEAVSEPAFERGIILGIRPLPTASLPEPRLRLVSQVMGAARGAGSAEANAVELVVRLERGGRDVALVQPAESWLRPGQRVRITPGARPSLARDPSGA